jgi:hypothetical protein
MIETKFISHRTRCWQKIEGTLYDATEAGALKLKESVVREMKSGGRTGTWYRLPGTKRGRSKRDRRKGLPSEGAGTKGGLHKWWQASAPGEYPAVRLGDLSGARGLRIDTRTKGTTVVSYVHTKLAYAKELEGKKTAKGRRPFLKRALNEHWGEIQGAIDRVAAELKKDL